MAINPKATDNWWTKIQDWQIDTCSICGTSVPKGAVQKECASCGWIFRSPLTVCEGRVRFWLYEYPRLLVAVQDGVTLELDPGTGGGSNDDMTWWERLVTTKADLDIALKHCTDKQQQAVKTKFWGGRSYRSAGRRLGCSHVNVIKLCQAGILTMAKRLAGEDK